MWFSPFTTKLKTYILSKCYKWGCEYWQYIIIFSSWVSYEKPGSSYSLMSSIAGEATGEISQIDHPLEWRVKRLHAAVSRLSFLFCCCCCFLFSGWLWPNRDSKEWKQERGSDNVPQPSGTTLWQRVRDEWLGRQSVSSKRDVGRKTDVLQGYAFLRVDIVTSVCVYSDNTIHHRALREPYRHLKSCLWFNAPWYGAWSIFAVSYTLWDFTGNRLSFHLWKAKFFILCDVIFLGRL